MFGSEAWSLTCNSGNGIVITLRDLDPLQEDCLTVSCLTVSLSITYKDRLCFPFLLLPPPLLSAHLVVPPRGPLECGEAGGARAAQPQHMKAQKYNKQAHSIKVNMLNI